MTTSELNRRLNDILEYMRDCGDTTNILPLCINVSSIKNLSDNTFLMLMHTLIDDKYIKAEKEEMSISNAYYIIKKGIYFINNGGYDVENTNEAKSKIIEIAPKSTIKHSTHDPNLWSVKSYELFKYLFENYYSGKNTELMNIWFFIKSDIGKDYLPKPPKALYLKMILDTYNIKITNFDRPTNWFEKHLPIFKGHLTLFEQNS